MNLQSKGNAQERVSLTLFQSIRQGKYPPGMRISARAVAAELGVSVTPVREALIKLEALGAVVSSAGGSPHIPQHSRSEILQLYTTRITLEGQAAAEAAEHITSRELDDLCRVAEAARKAYMEFDLRRILELNEEFHFAIYAAARNRILFDIIGLLWLRSGPLLPTVYAFDKVGRQQFSVANTVDREDNHATLLASLEARDREGARTAMSRDIQTGVSVYQALKFDMEQTIAELTKSPIAGKA